MADVTRLKCIGQVFLCSTLTLNVNPLGSQMLLIISYGHRYNQLDGRKLPDYYWKTKLQLSSIHDW